MTTFTFEAPSSDDASSLSEAVDKVENLHLVPRTTGNIVEVFVDDDVDAALELLVDLLMIQPFYGGAALNSPLDESLKQTARIIAGRGAVIDAAVADAINGSYTSARSYTPPPPIRRDPLALDLDGDGIETLAADGSVLFDHTSDGVKLATGWVAPDDGFLVLDRNENGTIDNGRELFGDSTLLSDGTTAEDGLAALADLDGNGDGRIDASDTVFADLRVWRDLNSDGISQAGELFSLGEIGIASISTEGVVDGTDLGDGNLSAKTGTFTYVDGTTGSASTSEVSTGTTADLDLAENPFYREFAETVAISPELEGQPDMQGSGAVRDLLEAASLSSSLASTLISYASASTRSEQFDQLDSLVYTWAASSSMNTSVGEAATEGYELI
jgi:hypothetical protein